MITIEPLSESGHVVSCPHCRAAILKVFGDRQETTFDGYLFHDGDTIPIYDGLSQTQREGFGWTTQLSLANVHFAMPALVSIQVGMMDVEPDTDTENVFFHQNGDRGKESNFLAQRGAERWIATRFDTPQGPMIEHDFGTFHR